MCLHLWVKGGCCASFDGKMSVQAFSSLCTHVPALPWISVSVHWCWKSLLAEKEFLIGAVKRAGSFPRQCQGNLLHLKPLSLLSQLCSWELGEVQGSTAGLSSLSQCSLSLPSVGSRD